MMRRSFHHALAPRRGSVLIVTLWASLGLVDLSHQEVAPYVQVSGMRRVDGIAVGFERCPRGVECSRRPAEITRGERPLTVTAAYDGLEITL